MKVKLLATVVLAATMIGGGAGDVLAGYGPDGPFGGPRGRMEMLPEKVEGRIEKILELTDAQQSQIKAILDVEHELVKPLFDKMHEFRKLLIQATEATSFDESAVRVLAVEQAKIETELIVSRTRAQNKIRTLLTQEQRELLKKLRPDNDHAHGAYSR